MLIASFLLKNVFSSEGYVVQYERYKHSPEFIFSIESSQQTSLEFLANGSFVVNNFPNAPFPVTPLGQQKAADSKRIDRSINDHHFLCSHRPVHDIFELANRSGSRVIRFDLQTPHTSAVTADLDFRKPIIEGRISITGAAVITLIVKNKV